MKCFKYILFIVLFINTFYASAPDTLWTKTYSGIPPTSTDYGRCVRQTDDGGFIIAGYHTWSGGAGLWLLKTDINGDTTWTLKKEPGDGYEMQQTKDKGYIVVGAGLLKVDSCGNISWVKRFDYSWFGTGRSVQQTLDGGFIIAGDTRYSDEKSHDICLIKTDENGNTTWTRTYGGSSVERGFAVQQLSDNGYMVIGYTAFYPKSFDIWLIRTDDQGDTLWTKNYGGFEIEHGKAGQQTSDGGFIILGETTSYSAGRYDIWLVKTDAKGDTLWTRTYGGTGQERAWDVHQTFDGGYIIAASTESYGVGNSDAWIIKTDAQGDTLWTKVMGGTDYDLIYSVRQTWDGGYILTGHKAAPYKMGPGGDLWLIRLAPDTVTSIAKNEQSMPKEFTLHQNYPNPFNHSTTIEYEIFKDARVILKIVDLKGREVKTIVNEYQTTGKYSLSWDGTVNGINQPSGVYFYQIETGVLKQTKKMLFLK
ncbi:MAG TPA: hypothetical protein DHW42_11325 [Candidatus Marinimicrobia bacterium]|nr:hypothetical protein [Candidatus Neomarinimicrobiota bacterium]